MNQNLIESTFVWESNRARALFIWKEVEGPLILHDARPSGWMIIIPSTVPLVRQSPTKSKGTVGWVESREKGGSSTAARNAKSIPSVPRTTTAAQPRLQPSQGNDLVGCDPGRDGTNRFIGARMAIAKHFLNQICVHPHL